MNEANLGDLLTLTNGMCSSIVFIWYVDLICLVLLTRSLFPFIEISKIDLRSLLALQGKKLNYYFPQVLDCGLSPGFVLLWFVCMCLWLVPREASLN